MLADEKFCMPHDDARRTRLDPWLVAIFLIGGLVGALIVGRAKNWAVMPDELTYVELSRSITHSILPVPALQGHYASVYQVLYPALIAPLIGILGMPAAYSLIAALNALLLASASIPAYMTTRHVTGSRVAARWVALCCVTTPWLVFASKVMPDAAAFAATTWAFFAIIRTAAPSARPLKGDLLTLLAIVVAFLVRNQFLFLLGVWIGAVVLAQSAQDASSGRGWREVPRGWLKLLKSRPLPIWIFVVVVLLLELKPGWVLGLYTSVATVGSDALPGEGLPRQLLRHSNVFALGLAVLPVVLGLPWLLSALTRIKHQRQFVTASVIVLATLAVIWIAASFDMRFELSGRVNERYMFYLAPLWFTAMAALFTHPPKNIAAFALPAVAGALLAIANGPYGLDNALNRMLNRTFSPTQVVLIDWQKVADALGTSIAGLVIIVSLLVCAAVWWALSKGRATAATAGAFGLVVLISGAGMLSTVPDAVNAQNSAPEKLFGPRDNAQKSWIETATDGAPWALVYSRNSLTAESLGKTIERKEVWRDAAFWSAGMQAIYVEPPLAKTDSVPLIGPTTVLAPDWQSGRLPRADGDRSEHLLTAADDPHMGPLSADPPLVRDGLALWRTGAERRASWALRGLTASGWIEPDGATLRLWAPQRSGAAAKCAVSITVAPSPRAVDGDLLTGEGLRRVRIERGPKQTTWTLETSVAAGGHKDIALTRAARPTQVKRVRAGCASAQ